MIEKITTWDVKQETCILIGVITQKQDEAESKEYLEELEFLAYTAGAETQGVFTQKLERPDSSTFLGSGKIQEIKDFIDEHDIDLAIFDDELTPSQMKNIEKCWTSKSWIGPTSSWTSLQLAHGPLMPAHRLNWRNANTSCLDSHDCGPTWNGKKVALA